MQLLLLGVMAKADFDKTGISIMTIFKLGSVLTDSCLHDNTIELVPHYIQD